MVKMIPDLLKGVAGQFNLFLSAPTQAPQKRAKASPKAPQDSLINANADDLFFGQEQLWIWI